MQCPQCHGDYEPLDLHSISGALVKVKRCNQCGGFWFPKPIKEHFQAESVAQYDRPVPNYSLRNLDLICPNDQTVMSQIEDDGGPSGAKRWSCPDCDGTFFPKGQLALFSQEDLRVAGSSGKIGLGRAQAAGAVSLSVLLVIAILGAVGKVNPTYLAADNNPLPTSGPNVFTLILLALTYLAGTVLAVLGRRLVLIMIGWGVIIVCLVGFAVIIFGP
jgi:hypothetical protein